MLHASFEPLLWSILAGQTDAEKIGILVFFCRVVMPIEMTKNAFAKLQVSLTLLQQDVDIPEVVLVSHPLVLQVMQKVFFFIQKYSFSLEKCVESCNKQFIFSCCVYLFCQAELEGRKAVPEDFNLWLDAVNHLSLCSAPWEGTAPCLTLPGSKTACSSTDFRRQCRAGPAASRK